MTEGDIRRAVWAVLLADLAYCLWCLLGRPGARCPACRGRLTFRHRCDWYASLGDEIPTFSDPLGVDLDPGPPVREG